MIASLYLFMVTRGSLLISTIFLPNTCLILNILDPDLPMAYFSPSSYITFMHYELLGAKVAIPTSWCLNSFISTNSFIKIYFAMWCISTHHACSSIVIHNSRDEIPLSSLTAVRMYITCHHSQGVTAKKVKVCLDAEISFIGQDFFHSR